MAWESLGDVGSGQMPNDEPWIMLCHKLAKTYLLHICGSPPDECDLGTFWQDHDLGSYPSFGLYREYGTWDSDRYFTACESALEKFNSAIDWNTIKPEFVDDKDEEIEEAEPESEGYKNQDKFSLKLAIAAAELFMKQRNTKPAEAMVLQKVIKALDAIPTNLLFKPKIQCSYKVDYLRGNRENGESSYIEFELTDESFQISKGANVYTNSNIVDSFSEVCFFMGADGLRSGFYDLSNLENTIVEYLHLGAEVIVTGGN